MNAFLRTVLFAAVLGSPAFAADPTPPSVLPVSAHDGPIQVLDLTPPHLPGAHAAHADAHHKHEPGGWFASGEYLLWRPRPADAAYALVDPRNDLFPQGTVRGVESDVGSGLRVGFGRRFANGWDVGFAYTYLHSHGDATAAAPPGGVLYPLLTRPGGIDKALVAAAGTDLDYHIFDLDFGRNIALDESLSLRTFAGLRFASIDTELAARYDGLNARQTLAGVASRFDGLGPTAGAEVTWLLGEHLSLFGGGRGGLLYGTFDGDLLELHNGDTTLRTDINDRYSGVTPMMSARMGASWCWRNVTLAAGYEVTHWFGVSARPTLVDDFAEGKLMRRRGDLSLDGFFFKVGVGY